MNNEVHLEKTLVEKAESYWLKTLVGELPTLNLPRDYSKTNLQDFNYTYQTFQIDAQLTKTLRNIAEETGTTLHTLLLAAYQVLIAKYSRQEDVIVGLKGNVNNYLEHELIESNITDTPLRGYPTCDKKFITFLQEIKHNVLQILKYKNYPIQNMIQKLNITRESKHHPLFDTMFIFENANGGYTNNNENQFYDLTLIVNEKVNQLSCRFSYSLNLFKPETIQRMATHFKEMLLYLSHNIDHEISQINIMSEKEQKQILIDFNMTEKQYNDSKLIHQLFEEVATEFSDNIAVVCENEKITYKELNEKANQLARLLRKEGVKANEIVSIMTYPSVEMIIGILGTLKAGAAYLPIDPEYPVERIQYILQDSNSKCLLTQRSLINTIETDLNKVILDDKTNYSGENSNLISVNSVQDLVYVIYTSGTTGKPKGVQLEHRNLVNYVNWFVNQGEIKSRDKSMLVSSFAFDLGYTSLYSSLLSGSQLHLVQKDLYLHPLKFWNYINNKQITFIKLTPSLLSGLVQGLEGIKNNSTLRLVVCGGESIRYSDVEKFHEYFPETIVMNHYGPTEATIGAIAKQIDFKELKGNSPNQLVGQPIYNTEIMILDKNKNIVPIGIPGELCISGAGLARGYLSKEILTNEKFIEHPYKPGQRLYFTGDLARWRSDGNVEYISRIDNQVKVRGYRIELNEIETILLQKEEITNAAVMIQADSTANNKIYAYYTSNTRLTEDGIRRYLSTYLPDYMIPDFYGFLEEIPLTRNGKVDFSKLPELSNKSLSTQIIPPRNETEKKLVDIWRSLFESECIGIEDNFFDLGGHSIKAMILVSRIQKEMNTEIPIRLIFNNPTIRKVAEYIQNQRGKSSDLDIKKAIDMDSYPVSAAQKRILIMSQFDNVDITYNIPKVYKLEGNIDKECLKKAFQSLVNHHESIRTYFDWIDGIPVQHVQPNVIFNLEYKHTNSEKIDVIVKEIVKPFDLSKAPLLRAALITNRNNENYLVIDIHHVVSDAISSDILLEDLAQFYSGNKVEENPIQYRDFSVWEKNQRATSRMKKQKAYWLEQLSGDLPVLNLPTDFLRPSIQSFEGDVINFEINKELKDILQKLASETGTTMYMVLLAAFKVLLARYSGQNDILVGSPIAGRSQPKLENIVGMFVNTLVMRSFPTGDKAFKEFLNEIKNTAIEAYDNQDYPFDELVENLDITRDMSRNPIFDTMFNMYRVEKQEKEMNGLRLIPYQLNRNISKFDLSLDAYESEDRITCSLEYCTRLFKKEKIEKMSEHFICILRQIATDNEVTINEINMLTDAEKDLTLIQFNKNQSKYPTNKMFHELFEEQVQKTPDVIVAHYGEDYLTYQELNEKANQLARILRNKGVIPDSIVGIMLNRSLEMFVAAIAVMKAGGAYLPIDPEYPEDRIQYLLEDSKAMLLLSQVELRERINFDKEILYINEVEFIEDTSNLDTIQGGENLAYIIYTSGTTGKPKGVMVEQRNYTNIVYAWREVFKFNNYHVKLLQMASFAFDVCAGDMARTIVNGGSMIVCPNEIKLDPPALYKLMKKHGVNVFESTPALIVPLMQYIYENKLDISQLKLLILGADTLTIEDFEKLIERFGNDTLILNTYGVTEATIESSYYEKTKDSAEYFGNLPIGRPLPNMTFYVLNEGLKPQPIGIPGELYIGGLGVTRGYFNNPELTSAKFINNPFVPGEKMYRTGDVVRWMEDGNIQFFGRNDHQVKIRGFRIEIGEIETQIRMYEDIKQAVVIAKEDLKGEKFLCLYFVANREISSKEIGGFLGGVLPSYMIPSQVMQLDKMPLSPNGKIDRKSLPEVELLSAEVDYEPPANEEELIIAETVSNVLGFEKVGVLDNFFDLGATSLKVMRIVSKLSLNFELSVNDVFRSQCIRELAGNIVFKKNQLHNRIEKRKQQILNNEDQNESKEVNTISPFIKKQYDVYQENIKSYKDLNLLETHDYKNILLCGATGYLGIHLLADLLVNNTANIILLIRANSREEALERLYNKLNFYGLMSNYEKHSKRVQIVLGNIQSEHLGVGNLEYSVLSEEVDCIINTAANVKHIGKYESFYGPNVQGTKNLIDFAEIGKEKHVHLISTYSVASGKIPGVDEYFFTEFDCDVNQQKESYYVETKLLSEKLIIEARDRGVVGNIYRVGNLMFQSDTGIFQENIEENAFYSTLRTYINLGVVEENNQKDIDFTFIDQVSKAFVSLFNKSDLSNETHHLFNPNQVSYSELFKLFNENGLSTPIVSSLEFLNFISENINKEEYSAEFDNLLLRTDTFGKSTNVSDFIITNDKTEFLLSELGFSWSVLTKEHIEKMLNHCHQVDFIKLLEMAH
ncbi:non-ribosomal peptide synthetase [Priestia megaterium]